MNTNASIESKDPRSAQLTLLSAVLEYLALGGATKMDLKALTAQALSELTFKRIAGRKVFMGDSTDSVTSATAIQRWYIERRLTTSDGSPKPLRLLGPAPSVESLLRRGKSATPARSIAAELLKLKLLKRTRKGEYLPTGRHIIIHRHHPFTYEQPARTMVRLLRTVGQNASVNSSKEVLIERCARVKQLPQKKLQEFRDFTNQQGEVFIDSVNDWLESHNTGEVSKRKSNVTEAGVHVFAFTGTKR
jgi:hypothetical protein